MEMIICSNIEEVNELKATHEEIIEMRQSNTTTYIDLVSQKNQTITTLQKEFKQLQIQQDNRNILVN